ncbi:MAG: hypothetical protein ACLQPD_29150 [Desulfomonilaceae bacterium]
MDDLHRLRFAVEYVSKEKSVVFIPKEDWFAKVEHSGEPAILEELPKPLKELEKQSCYLATTASGYNNPEPGMDVFRKADPPERDGSTVNEDHYSVIEDLLSHPHYQRSLQAAGIEETADLKQTVQDHVFIVGPSQPKYHWRKDLPLLVQKYLYPTTSG